MFHKSLKLRIWSVPIMVTSLCLYALQARAEPPKQAAKTAHQEVTTTGCLQKGDEAGEFHLKDDNGKSWELRSTSVKLASHVGHKVEVVGSPVKESESEEKKETSEKKEAGEQEYGQLKVTKLKMVSETCK